MKTPMIGRVLGSATKEVENICEEGKIEKLIKECESVSVTNCGWQEYGLAPLIVEYAKYLRDMKEAAQAGKGE